MLETVDLTIRRKRAKSIERLTFKANVGEMTCILGPTRSGKSTLMRAFAGGLKYRGSLSLNGRELRDMHPAEMALQRSSLPQDNNLDFMFTVREAININLRSKQSERREHHLSSLLEELGLAGLEDKPCRELTLCQQQRVALARSFIHMKEATLAGEARWLFLDEPFRPLSGGKIEAVVDFIQRFASAGGGVIIASQDSTLSDRLSCSSITLFDGKRDLAPKRPSPHWQGVDGHLTRQSNSTFLSQ